jgi:hypothetical protein
MSGIGLLNEKPLHAALKQWYARPGDRFEVAVDGFVIELIGRRGRAKLYRVLGQLASKGTDGVISYSRPSSSENTP